MANTTLNVVLKLRRDNDYNFEKIKDSFIPANGEPVLVDTARDGLRFKIGDGTSTYDQLEFVDSVYIHGYLYENNFYADADHTQLLNGVINKFYINDHNGKVYYNNGSEYLPVSGTTQADSTTAGIMMLYNTIGQNTDGTMTQKAITDELSEKFEININADEEMIIFAKGS